jgi:hypothetical protein
MSNGVAKFTLTNLTGGGHVELMYFPTKVSTERRSNWEEQDVVGKVKPLTFSNIGPRRVQIDELWLDRSDAGESIQPDIETLFFLMDVVPGKGMPPRLLITWGDRFEVGVLEEVRVAEEYFTSAGLPVRARCSVTFKELQEAQTQTTTTVT